MKYTYLNLVLSFLYFKRIFLSLFWQTLLLLIRLGKQYKPGADPDCRECRSSDSQKFQIKYVNSKYCVIRDLVVDLKAVFQ